MWKNSPAPNTASTRSLFCLKERLPDGFSRIDSGLTIACRPALSAFFVFPGTLGLVVILGRFPGDLCRSGAGTALWVRHETRALEEQFNAKIVYFLAQ